MTRRAGTAWAVGVVVALTACSGGSTAGKPVTASTTPSTASVSVSSTTPASATTTANTTGRSAAQWQHIADTAALTTSDLTSGYTSVPATEPNGQTECPSLTAVSASKPTDLAYRRASFQFGSTSSTAQAITFVDEVIGVSPDAGGVLDRFATTATACAQFTSTAANGAVVNYQVSRNPVAKVGDRVEAVVVRGTTSDGSVTVGSDVLVAQQGPVVIMIELTASPPPPVDLTPTIADLAFRKLARVLAGS